MSTSFSVTLWINETKDGDQAAAGRLYDRFRDQLVSLASRRMGNMPKRVADEEDVVQSAFASFWKGAVAGRFPRLRTSDDLWPLLKVIVERKAIDYAKRERRQKRGSGKVRGESDLPGGRSSSVDLFARIDDGRPSPVACAEADDWSKALLERLDDECLRKIAVWKAERYTNDEIAEMLPCSRATVARKLAIIRRIWQAEYPAHVAQ
jgi:RNA polymerase sigma factor (sigma-70 family)